MKYKKYNPVERREMLLSTAVQLATKIGYSHLTRDGIARVAGVSEGLINHYFGTIDNLKREVLQYAIKNKVLEIISQGICLRDPEALKVSSALKEEAINYMIN